MLIIAIIVVAMIKTIDNETYAAAQLPLWILVTALLIITTPVVVKEINNK